MKEPVQLIPTRPFGKSGEKVSCIGMGGSHLGKRDVNRHDAVRLIREGIDQGITFLDNSWDYNDGSSLRRMGPNGSAGTRSQI